MQSRFSFFIEILVVCCHHISISFGNLILSTGSSKFSSAWRSRYFRAFAYFASRLFGEWLNNVCTASVFRASKFCSKNVRKEEVQEVVCPRPLEIRLSNLKISSLILPWMVAAILVILFQFVARGRLQLVSASDHTEHGLAIGCLHAWDNQKKVVISCDTGVSLILDEIRWLSWMPFIRVTILLRTNYQTRLPRFFRLLNSTWTKVSTKHKHILLLLAVEWIVQFAVIITDGSFDSETVSCSTGAKSLWVIIWSEPPESTVISHLFDVGVESEETLLAGPVLKNMFRS